MALDKVFKTLGASNHSKNEREKNNYYATDPIAIDILFEKEGHNFNGKNILEPMCGCGCLSKRILELTKDSNVDSYDLIYRGFGIGGTDYLTTDFSNKYDIIISNPPYDKEITKMAIIKAINEVKENGSVYMMLRLLYLESINRYVDLFSKYPPCKVYIFANRISCWRDGNPKNNQNAQAYAWFRWDKGYNGDTYIDWLIDKNKLKL